MLQPKNYCNLAFVVSVYQDQHLAKRLLEQIANHCSCPVIVIGDGVKLEDHCKNSIWFECNRAKAKNQKGLWTQRYLELFLEHTAAQHLLKVDPDTCVWRPFSLPEGDYDLFGNIESKKYRYSYIRGGCLGYTRSAAQKIVESKLLLDDKYLPYNYKRYKDHCWSHEQESNEEFAFQDWIVSDIAYKLKFRLKEWNEIHILGNQNIVPKIENFVITHPHPI